MDWWKTVLPLQGAPSYDDKKLGREHDMESGGPDPEVEDKVMLKRHRVSRIFWNRHFFDYPISLSPNTLKAMGFKLTMVPQVARRQSGELLHQPLWPQAVLDVLRGIHREAVGTSPLPDFR